MKKAVFPSRVAVQDSAPQPARLRHARKFHKIDANHIAKGAHYTRTITLTRALADRWQPCQVCFREVLASPEKNLEAEVRALKERTNADLLGEILEADFPAIRVPRYSFERKRDAKVVEVVLRRADGRCERPGCTAELFQTDDGSPFLEVHHLRLLADDGPDHPENACALCPSCHRRMHSGRDRAKLLPALQAYIATAHAAFVALSATK